MTGPNSGGLRVGDLDAMFEAVRSEQVAECRVVAGPTAPDFYRYEFRIDGQVATERQRRALRALAARGAIHVGGYNGVFGPATVPVHVG